MRTLFRNRLRCTSAMLLVLTWSASIAAIPLAMGQQAVQVPEPVPQPVPLPVDTASRPSGSDPANADAAIADTAAVLGDIDPVARNMMTEFDKRVTAWTEEMAIIREAQIRFHNGSEESEEKYRNMAREHQPIARQRYTEVLEQAVKMLDHESKDGSYLKAFLAQTIDHRGRVDWYENLAHSTELIESFLGENVHPDFYSVAGRAQVVAGNFDKARIQLQKAMQFEERLDCDIRLLNTLDALAAAWQEEQPRLDQDPDDLPLVELETTRGKIVVELFEDQAPNTVSNFINLVEQGFYDQLPFYQVLDHLFAMTGDPYGDGTGNSGNRIADEADLPDARSPLRGSLVMAKLPNPNDPQGGTIPDTASSQFMILMLPLDIDAGKYTTFGHVVEGLSAVSYFTRLDPSKKTEKNAVKLPPDLILSAKVLRKRNHPYKTKYVESD